jgi:carbonic anhydrase
MTLINELLAYNKQFVSSKQYEQYKTDKFPDKRMVILTCMDTRLVELLPKALNLKNGDAKIIKSAGAIVSHPFGGVMRSILIAVYELNAKEVLVIGHHDCGMTGMQAETIIEKAKGRGVTAETVNTVKHSGIDLERWLKGFNHVEEGVIQSVNIIKNHPLLPRNVPVHGLIIHPETGALDWIVNGYAEQAAFQ